MGLRAFLCNPVTGACCYLPHVTDLPVTIVLMGTAIWSLAEGVSHVTVAPRPLKAASGTRQGTLKLFSILGIRMNSEAYFPDLGTTFYLCTVEN